MKTAKVALITGITGQDGAYLTQICLNKGYKVIGLFRRSSTNNFWRLRDLDVLTNSNLKLVEGDLTDLSSIISIVIKYKPSEIYNLAAQSHVHTSFEQPILTANITGIGPLNILEAIRVCKQKGIFTVGFTGFSGGQMAGLADLCIKVPSTETPRIQESHILIGHVVCAIVENSLFGTGLSTA